MALTKKTLERFASGTTENVRAGPGVEYDVIGSLAFFDTFTVREVQTGWYRFTYGAQQAWVAGWLTSERL